MAEESKEIEADFKCNTCKSCFLSIEKIKEHYRGDWHILNSKRRANGLIPLKRSEFKALIHQSPAKAPKSTNDKKVVADPLSSDPIDKTEDSVEKVEELIQEETPPVVTANISIFDDKVFDNVDDCVQYMALTFGFFIPDVEFLSDLEGLLVYLGEKVKHGGICLYCQKQCVPGRPCQQHMLSKSHCKIAYENGIDGEEFEDFYDFSASYEDMEDVELDENGEVIENEVEIASTGELVLADGRILGHRDFRRYYKQHYRPADTRAPILAQQREELLRLGGKFGGLTFTPEDITTMEDVQVMQLLVRYQKDVRKGMMVEQRAQLKKDGRNQRLEYNSKINKLRSSETTTAKIRDYHRIL